MAPAPDALRVALPAGAILYTLGSSGYVPPDAPNQTLRLIYETNATLKATAVLWQVSRVPFPAFKGSEADRQPEGLIDWGYFYDGARNGGFWELDVAALPAGEPSRRRQPAADFYARIIPIKSLQSPDMVGQPSKAFEIFRRPLPKTTAPPASTPPPGDKPNVRPGQQPFDLGTVIYVDHAELDRDRDGLDDTLETMLADRFKPLFVFDSAESARRSNEPVLLFQARPKGTVGLTNVAWDDRARIVIEYAELFARDGGYGPSSDCPDDHNGDNQTARVEITSRDGQIWTLELVTAGQFTWPRDTFGVSQWTGGPWEGLGFENEHPIIYMSAHKHHQYFSTDNDEEDSPYSDYGCNDDVNGKGARILPSVISPLPDKRSNNVGEPELHDDPADPAAAYFIDALDAFGYKGERAWSGKAFKGGLGDDGGDTSSMRSLWKRHAFDFVPGFSKFRPLGRLRGRVTDASGRPVPGLTLYFRNIHPLGVAFGGGRGPWSTLVVDANGSYDVTLPESTYMVRPAAGGFDFSGVPKSVFAKSAQTVTTDFTGTRRASLSGAFGGGPASNNAMANLGAGGVPPGSAHDAKVREAVDRFIQSYAASFLRLSLDDALVAADPESLDKGKADTDPFVELPRQIIIRAQLKRGLDAGGQVIADPLSIAATTTSAPTYDGGVAGARIRARLLAGPGLLGPSGESAAESLTDGFGNAYFLLHAGRHPGPISLEMQVVQNPVQPWGRFRRSEMLYIQPAIHGDDTAQPGGPSIAVGTGPTRQRPVTTNVRPIEGNEARPSAETPSRRPAQGQTPANATARPESRPAGASEPAPTASGRPGVSAVARGLPIVIEIESLLPNMKASAGTPVRQEMTAFGTGWGGNAQVFWRPPPPVDTPIRNWPHLTFSIVAPAKGTYRVTLVHTQAPDYGNATMFVRGTARGTLWGYAPVVRPARTDLGEFQLDAGANQVVVTVFGKNTESAGFVVGLDRIELQRR